MTAPAADAATLSPGISSRLHAAGCVVDKRRTSLGLASPVVAEVRTKGARPRMRQPFVRCTNRERSTLCCPRSRCMTLWITDRTAPVEPHCASRSTGCSANRQLAGRRLLYEYACFAPSRRPCTCRDQFVHRLSVAFRAGAGACPCATCWWEANGAPHPELNLLPGGCAKSSRLQCHTAGCCSIGKSPLDPRPWCKHADSTPRI